MTITQNHTINIGDMQQDVAHLFEHLVIEGFYDKLTADKIPAHLVWWVEGGIFEDNLNIQTGSYNQEVAEKYDQYIKYLPKFTEIAIQKSISNIQAEDEAIIQINDRLGLQSHLELLSQRIAGRSENITPNNKSILSVTSKSNIFDDILVLIKTKQLTADEQKVFLRFYVILSEVVEMTISQTSGHHRQNISNLLKQDNQMGFALEYTINRKNYKQRELDEEILDSILDLSKTKFMNAINDHFFIYASSHLWSNDTNYFYDNFGIKTNLAEIVKLATPNRMQSILSKISIEVHKNK